MTNEEIKKKHDFITNVSKKCKCGHSVVLPIKREKIICKWCGCYIFKDEKTEFIYRTQEEIKRKLKAIKEE